MLKKRIVCRITTFLARNKSDNIFQKKKGNNNQNLFVSIVKLGIYYQSYDYKYMYRNEHSFYKNIVKTNVKKKIFNIEKKINKGIVIIPLGGLGEIGMNCMLLGIDNRFILIDAGIMFSELSIIGIKKVLPDINFLGFFRDKIEALVITHGHEDHIGALEWVNKKYLKIIPALDQATIIYSPRLVFNIFKKRYHKQKRFLDSMFVIFKIKTEFVLGPFMCQVFRVTHSIPDCCGLVFKSYLGNLLHTGDWKIDDYPLDGEQFDKLFLEKLAREKVLLMMSDSTNAMSSGRSDSEKIIQNSIIKKIINENDNRRIIITQFASNLFRLNSIRKAAELSKRKITFIGVSLHSYLEAALLSGRAPLHPGEVAMHQDLEKLEPDKLIIVTTGSQGEENGTLNLASIGKSNKLKINSNDTVIYSAKIIPGNDKKVVRMLNRISNHGCKIIYGSAEKLHTSGHAYIEELKEIIRIVKPLYFLPIHGEIISLYAHSQLALKECGVKATINLRNGQVLVINNMSDYLLSWNIINIKGEINCKNFFSILDKWFLGTYENSPFDERIKMAKSGILVIVIDFHKKKNHNNIAIVNSRIKITSRGIWINRDIFYKILKKVLYNLLKKIKPKSSISTIERIMRKTIENTNYKLNVTLPNVIISLNEYLE
uniref:Regulator of transcription that contains myb domains n=1 Tax=Lotharella vacuolata TaxID=74820 RepID=A0A0H5BK84_9EUKA|nr:regulator of transcription that contains myb domains [Lotharella vacuolata]